VGSKSLCLIVRINGRDVRANRYVCEHVHGAPSTPTLIAFQKCGNKHCFSPWHVDWVTDIERRALNLVMKGPLRESGLATYGAPLEWVKEAIKHVKDECLFWPFGLDSKGYGSLRLGGKTNRPHRMVCEAVHGPASFERAEVLHSCDNPACCASAHLCWGTHEENMRDARNKGRMRGWFQLGQASPTTRLDATEISEIHKLRAAGCSYKDIAARFAISRAYAGQILSGYYRSNLHPNFRQSDDDE
jgi:hypothetical protein